VNHHRIYKLSVHILLFLMHEKVSASVTHNVTAKATFLDNDRSNSGVTRNIAANVVAVSNNRDVSRMHPDRSTKQLTRISSSILSRFLSSMATCELEWRWGWGDAGDFCSVLNLVCCHLITAPLICINLDRCILNCDCKILFLQ